MEREKSKSIKAALRPQGLIEISDAKYAAWHKEILRSPEKYDGLRIRVKLFMRRPPNLEGKCFPGRIALGSCENDMRYLGIAAEGSAIDGIKNLEWFRVSGIIRAQEHEAYKGRGPVLYVDEAVKCSAPDQEYV